MADSLTFKTDDFVKWPITGGMAVGQIVGFKGDNKFAKIETPTGHITETSLDNLVVSNEQEYDESVAELVTSVGKRKTRKTKKTETVEETASAQVVEATTEKGDTMADVTQATVDAVKAEFNTAKQFWEKTESELRAALASQQTIAKEMEEKVCAMTTEYENAKKACATLEASLSEANAKIANAAKAQLAQARLTKIKEVDAIAAIADDEAKATAALGEMAEDTFAMVYRAAAASFKKLTDQTQTSLPKLTDQTQTSMPKLTDQTQAAEAALKNAEPETDNAMATAGSVVATESPLAKFADAIIGKNLNNSKKIKK